MNKRGKFSNGFGFVLAAAGSAVSARAADAHSANNLFFITLTFPLI